MNRRSFFQLIAGGVGGLFGLGSFCAAKPQAIHLGNGTTLEVCEILRILRSDMALLRERGYEPQEVLVSDEWWRILMQDRRLREWHRLGLEPLVCFGGVPIYRDAHQCQHINSGVGVSTPYIICSRLGQRVNNA
jgi:hypothetical protein